jgi:hypothetical protein
VPQLVMQARWCKEEAGKQWGHQQGLAEVLGDVL